jgi:hypothetical protein
VALVIGVVDGKTVAVGIVEEPLHFPSSPQMKHPEQVPGGLLAMLADTQVPNCAPFICTHLGCEAGQPLLPPGLWNILHVQTLF